MRIAFALALVGVAAPTLARDRLAQVPFVGCPSDGQTGPVPAPRRHQTPAVPVWAAARLAFYATDYSMALAPRGWHCIGLYGSSGQTLIVTPERHKADEFLLSRSAPIRGAAVQVTVSIGGTSGRLSAAPIAGRYFPKYWPAYRAYLDEMKDLDPDFRPRSERPYASDTIRKRTSSYLRFTTPARSKGEGTNSVLLPGNLPIEGFLKLVGPVDEPDLVRASVRLPAAQADLVDVILADAAN